jgi:hypothetical protein
MPATFRAVRPALATALLLLAWGLAGPAGAQAPNATAAASSATPAAVPASKPKSRWAAAASGVSPQACVKEGASCAGTHDKCCAGLVCIGQKPFCAPKA